MAGRDIYKPIRSNQKNLEETMNKKLIMIQCVY